MAVNRVPGVLESEFSYEEGSGVVTYDPEATDPETFLAALSEKTGFRGRVIEPRMSPERNGERNQGGDPRQPTDHERTDPHNR